jgi:hypothetical protein
MLDIGSLSAASSGSGQSDLVNNAADIIAAMATNATLLRALRERPVASSPAQHAWLLERTRWRVNGGSAFDGEARCLFAVLEHVWGPQNVERPN